MSQTAAEVLAGASFESDGREYSLLRLPATAIPAAAGAVAQVSGPFCALVIDRHEISLVLPRAALPQVQESLPEVEVAAEVCRLITVNVIMEPELTGLVARISEALADAGVPVLPFASFSRDHVLVPAAQVDDALDALRRLQHQA